MRREAIRSIDVGAFAGPDDHERPEKSRWRPIRQCRITHLCRSSSTPARMRSISRSTASRWHSEPMSSMRPPTGGHRLRARRRQPNQRLLFAAPSFALNFGRAGRRSSGRRPRRSARSPLGACGRERGSKACGWSPWPCGRGVADRRQPAVRPLPRAFVNSRSNARSLLSIASPTIDRISGSAIASEDALSTVKHPRGPVSPLR